MCSNDVTQHIKGFDLFQFLAKQRDFKDDVDVSLGLCLHRPYVVSLLFTAFSKEKDFFEHRILFTPLLF